jgi:hypothetical protein
MMHRVKGFGFHAVNALTHSLISAVQFQINGEHYLMMI